MESRKRLDMDYLFKDENNSDDPEAKKAKNDTDDEEDPLDAFMAGITEQAAKDVKESEEKSKNILENNEVSCSSSSNYRMDIEEEEDSEEAYFKYLKKYENQIEKEDTFYEYDEDGNIIATHKKEMELLEPVDHSQINYKPFVSDIYIEHEDISKLTPNEIYELRKEYKIQVYGKYTKAPIVSFGHLSQNKILLSMISHHNFEKPTPIQAQAIPSILSGRNVLGIAQTGTGKTLAYVLPAILHVLSQDERTNDIGPVVLIVVPTRELALQVFTECRKYGRPFDIKTVCAYGGGNKYEQTKDLKEYSDIVVCTPGRMIDLVKDGATNLQNVTFLVFDEADRMFECGFEAQVQTISDQIRPDRQCVMFSATFKHKVEKLALKVLSDPVKIVCGEFNEVNSDVSQHVIVLPNTDDAKWNWLQKNIIKFLSSGKVIIFVTKKVDSVTIYEKLKKEGIKAVLLYGDLSQFERNEKILAFRQDIDCLVATDVAARGLDIPNVKTVVNYDVPRQYEYLVHRIGRTGRAGQKGDAYTLMTENDKNFAVEMVKNFELNGYEVSDDLMNLALKVEKFFNEREKFVSSVKVKAKLRPGIGFSKDNSVTKKTTNDASLRKEIKVASSGAKYVPGLTKQQAVKSVYQKTFGMSFVKASKPEEPDVGQDSVESDPRPEWKKRLEERVANIKAEFASKKQS
ncbi:ATP-dependent RNA helicase DDX42 [Strongyloides ratti]|uniref:RNA helicase n=1 Tax=Strongyloides ratti TaxID=34506 RepID=A0A090LDX3_STRRB|nr:ATP-dependent RNA helicase DDX42 [Strongyloides ratti]CEF67996.1 ATP-dependent RNA helicase DDX42 [Strongyloides ratti]